MSENARKWGTFAGVGGLAIGLGPVIAGALLNHFWWGSVFLINVPIMVVALVAGAVVPAESRDPVPGRLDLPSVPLSAAGVVGLVYAVKEAAAHGLDEGRGHVAAAAGVVALGAFLVRQGRLAEPLIDIRLFRRAAFAGSVGTNMFAMFALVAQSLIFQLALGWSPLRAGLAGLPAALGAMAGGAALAPALISALGRARTVAAGMLAAAHLPGAAGAQVAETARAAFVDGMHAALTCSAGFAAMVAVFALVTLRNVPKVIPDAEETEESDLVTTR